MRGAIVRALASNPNAAMPPIQPDRPRMMFDRIRFCPPTCSTILIALSAACGDPRTPSDTNGNETAVCETAGTACAARISIGVGVYLPIYSTFRLDVANADVEEGVIVVHGANRDAHNYFESMVLAARHAGRLDRALIVAPRFQIQSDGPLPDEPYWTEGGWKRGHLSVVGGPTPRTSSYAALDRIVVAMADRSRFPNLKRIIVAGHSAGGQVVHRYAAVSRAQEGSDGIAFRYVVTNPSTYLYLTPERQGIGGDFALPDTDACPSWDGWHYGLGADLNSYAQAVPTSQIRAHLTARDVRILIGSADTGTAELDITCGAYLQGQHRYERGRTLVRYMDALHPGHNHREMIVTGVGHNSRTMFTSPVGLEALFAH